MKEQPTEVSQTDHQVLIDPETESQKTEAEQEDNHGDDLDKLPIQLEVALAEIDLPLAKFRSLTTGMTVPLQVDLTDHFDITANGLKFGEGVLVQIGDRVGIQIVKWTAKPEH